jgi:hypothetical protein
MYSWGFINDFNSFLGFLGFGLGFHFLRFLRLGSGLGLNKMTLHMYVCLKYYTKFYTIHRFYIYVCISYNILNGINYMITYQNFV